METTAQAIRVETTGRTDRDDLFALSGVLHGRLNHTPFLAFQSVHDGDEPVVRVSVMESATAAAALPPETPLMVQWRGQWRSDFFRLTAGELRDALTNK